MANDDAVDPVQEAADKRAQVGHEGDPAAEDMAKAQEAAEDEAAKRDTGGSGRRLVANVHVTNPTTGERKVFGPEDELPDWAEEAITNPAAYASDDDTPDEPPVPGPGQFQPGGVAVRSRDDLYELSKSELLTMAEEAGIEGLSTRDTKQEIVEQLTAR